MAELRTSRWPALTRALLPDVYALRWRTRDYIRLFLVALAVRLAALLVVHSWPSFPVEHQTDGESEFCAVALLDSGIFANPYLRDTTLPTTWRTPLHSFVIAGCMLATESWLGPCAFPYPLYVLQSLASAGVVLGGAWLAQRWFGREARTAAAVLLTLYMPSIYYAVYATGDAAFVSVALVGLVVLFELAMAHPRLQLCLRLGVCAGLCALLNPNTLSVSIPLGILLVARSGWNAAGWATAKAATILAAILLTVSPWVVRNRILLGEWTFLRSSFGFDLWAGNHDDGEVYISPDEFVLSQTMELSIMRELGEIRYSRERLKVALRWIAADPTRFVSVSSRRAGAFWTKEVFWGAHPLVTAPLVGLPLVLGVLGLCALATRRRCPYGLAIPVVFFPLIYYVTHIEARYRAPVDSFLLLAASHVIARLCTMGTRALPEPTLQSHAKQ